MKSRPITRRRTALGRPPNARIVFVVRLFAAVALSTVLLVWALAGSSRGAANDDHDQKLASGFKETVQPFVATYCISCHGPEKNEGQLDLSGDVDLTSVVQNQRNWQRMLERLESHEMPPDDAPRQPTDAQRQVVVEWIKALRTQLIESTEGDPGPVLPRRLSHAEYNNTIRDLTGVDLQPAREFPVDPTNEAGFSNSGESLSMTPDLLRKYLEAARLVADHLALTPDGFRFAEHPMVSDTDRDKYCVQRIVDFYERQPTDLADYFVATVRFAREPNTMSLDDIAREAHISAKYLTKIWTVLQETSGTSGPLAELRTKWRELIGSSLVENDLRRAGEELREFVVEQRRLLQPRIENLRVRGISTGSQPLVLWKNRQMAANRLRYDGPAEGAERAALESFCATFPDRFYIAERGRVFLDESEQADEAKGRLLSAGFHLMVGYFRDDAPLCHLILDEHQRQELDQLWDELHFITLAPLRQYKDFLFFERAEPPRYMQDAQFDFARPENKDSVLEENIQRLSELYVKKAESLDAGKEALNAIRDYFHDINVAIREVERARLAAESAHLEALQEFCQRAYRRPLSSDEREELLAFYRQLRSQQGLTHEEAVRDCIASILVSPHFCYLVQLPPSGDRIQPLSDYALASRLSYFLWSSMPDAELLQCAATGQLHQRDVLLAQTRRMLSDERVRGLATEFGADWLDFRGFEQHNAVDRARFPQFTDALRAAMREEPIRFFMDVAQQNRSVLDFIDADYTFVNATLARHYGVDLPFEADDQWLRVDQATRFGRGGLLPMSIFLTRNAPGLRTSPVKRGYWVVRRLLGEHIPPPPPTVPELPKDEAQLGDLNVRQLLAKHRDNESCAGCHERFDSIGFAFEGYGPIGETRLQDLGGKPVDAQAVFPDGSEGSGLEGLRDYLRAERQEDFLDVLCRKMLAYALGRGLQLSDEPAIEKISKRLSQDGYRFHTLVEAIVTSSQFQSQRGRDYESVIQ